MSNTLSDQEVIRREALQKLRGLGIDPFPAAEYKVSPFIVDGNSMP